MIALIAIVAAAAAVFFILRSRKAHASEGPSSERVTASYQVQEEPARRMPSVQPFEPPPKPAPLPPPPPLVQTPARLLPDHNLAVQAIVTPGLLTKLESQQVGWAIATDLTNMVRASVNSTFRS